MEHDPSPFPTAMMPSEEDLAKMRRAMRMRLLTGILIGALGAGASALSCVGQSFSLRQARALEAIAHQLDLQRTPCQGSETIVR